MSAAIRRAPNRGRCRTTAAIAPQCPRGRVKTDVGTGAPASRPRSRSPDRHPVARAGCRTRRRLLAAFARSTSTARRRTWGPRAAVHGRCESATETAERPVLVAANRTSMRLLLGPRRCAPPRVAEGRPPRDDRRSAAASDRCRGTSPCLSAACRRARRRAKRPVFCLTATTRSRARACATARATPAVLAPARPPRHVRRGGERCSGGPEAELKGRSARLCLDPR